MKNKEKRRTRDLEGFGDDVRPVLGRKTEGERERGAEMETEGDRD